MGVFQSLLSKHVQSKGEVRSIEYQADLLKNALELVTHAEDGTITICQPAAEQIGEQFRMFEELLQTLVLQHRENHYVIDNASLRSFKDVVHHAAKLFLKPTIKAQAHSQTEVALMSAETQTEHLLKSVETQTDSNLKSAETQTSIPLNTTETQTVNPLESFQVSAILGSVKYLPETMKVLESWLRASRNEEVDGSTVLNKHMLQLIGEKLQLRSITVGNESTITLNKSSMETILQNCKATRENQERKVSDSGTPLNTEELVLNKKQISMGKIQMIEPTTKAAVDDVKTTTIQVLDSLPSVATNNFIKSLQLKLETRKINLSLTDVAAFNNDSVNSNLVMVVCNNHSRLHADITSTLLYIKRERFQRIFLVVIHCTAERYLPTLPTKDYLRTEEEFEQITEAVDFAFDNNGGNNPIYDCEMNKKAVKEIEVYVQNGRLVLAK